MHIREFALRFASVLQLAQGHLDEFEEISGDNLGPAGGWDVEIEPNIDIISWVSELCAKAIIQGLLDVIATRVDGADETAIREAAKAVKNSGANLNRVWGALASLRGALESGLPAFCDPLPPPASTTIRSTRSGIQGKDSHAVHISNSAQLVPVIVDLIEAAIDSPAIRDALETGPTEEKELSKDAKEAIANENARWKGLSETKDKARRAQHSKLLEDLESSLRLATTRYNPRFAPLGQDLEGRVYYAMSPAVGESEA